MVGERAERLDDCLGGGEERRVSGTPGCMELGGFLSRRPSLSEKASFRNCHRTACVLENRSNVVVADA